MSRLGFAWVLVGVLGCAPKLPHDASSGGGDGGGLDGTGTWSEGESGDTTDDFGLGVRGVVIFDPVPESWGEAVLDMRLKAYDPDVADDVEADSVAWYREFVTESPAPFEITLHPNNYNPELSHSISGYGDMDRDETHSCGDYRLYLSPVDPASGEPVTITATPVEAWCEEPPNPSEPVDPCPGVPIPQPHFRYDEGLVERIDGDRIAVQLDSEPEDSGDSGYRWVFELGPDEQAPGTYTVPVEQQCYPSCPNPDFTEDVVIEVVSLDDCLAATFLEAPESNCSEFLRGCGGFVEPVL
jgi:hypothetical protein